MLGGLRKMEENTQMGGVVEGVDYAGDVGGNRVLVFAYYFLVLRKKKRPPMEASGEGFRRSGLEGFN